MYKTNKVIVAILMLFVMCIDVHAQEYIGQKGSSVIKVLGTSTVHDWEETATNFTSSLKLNKTASFEMKALELKVVAESLESGKDLMNKLTYEALKTEKHPNILFSLISQESVKTVKEGVYNVVLKGNLTIAGVKKEISLNIECTQIESVVVLKGSKKIKMTDYGMKPPKAMFGTIKTGDEITIEFTTQYKL